VERLCLTFADEHGVAFEVGVDDDWNGGDLLDAWFRMMRKAMERAVQVELDSAFVRFAQSQRIIEAGNGKGHSRWSS
jgi:hypothetical protein